jgi:hypothetical protein
MAINLRRLGMSWGQISERLDVDRTALINWCRDDAVGEPAFWTGASMIELWCERTGLRWTDVPTRKVAPSVSASLRG